MIYKCLKASFIFCLAFVSILPNNASAQNNDDAFEVYLTFRHRGVIGSYVTSFYKNDQFYLPVNELFSLLQLEASVEGLIISGNFSIDQIPYLIDFERRVIQFEDKRIDISPDDYILGDFDSFLRVDLFDAVFELDFTVDFNNLALSLNTLQELPIIEKALRDQKRSRTSLLRRDENLFDLRDGLNRNFFDFGFLDYSVNTTINSNTSSVSFNNVIGAQALGGDIQGAVFGNFSSDVSLIETNGLRWRYVVKEKPALTTVTVGQSNLSGALTTPYTGISISNYPIEPRLFFDEYEVNGITFPQSEVELYLNNSLLDFQQSDEIGNYRFLIPRYYGSSQLDIRIYGPTGQIINKRSRIQIPFTFIPKGELNYTANAGYVENFFIGETGKNYTFQGNAAYGLTNWLTTKFGVEYYDQSNGNSTPYFVSSVSSRLSNSTTLMLEGIYDGYIRSSINSIFANSASFIFDYTNFSENQSFYNASNNKDQFSGSLFFPFRIFEIPLNIRVSNFTRRRDTGNFSTFRTDLSTRIRKFSIRMGYTDRLTNTYNIFDPSPVSYFENSFTYTVPRNTRLPDLFKGFFVRGQARYLAEQSQLESLEFLVSRNVFKQGRFQLTLGRNYLSNENSIRFNIVIDFNKVRANSTFTQLGNRYSTTNSVRGSIGYDTKFDNLILTSRDQVGRSGAAIKLFVDNNNNKIYDEGIDDDIEEGRMRINRSGSNAIVKNGVLYYNQMQQYFQYNLEMNISSINNPMLVPSVDKFSIITDPNTYKRIEIPFFMAGVMEGGVNRVFPDSTEQGIGGLKIILADNSGNVINELRTFSDGSFYEYPIPPGSYTLSVDQSQLDILQVDASPNKIDFEVEAIQNGDFVEGLSFRLTPRSLEDLDEEAEQELITIAEVTDAIKASPEILEYSQEIFGTIDDALRYIVRAQNAFYSKNIDVAFRLVTESLELFETAQGHALKGSFYYFEGNIEQAQRHWEQALRFNPDLYIPDMETLEERVNTGASD